MGPAVLVVDDEPLVVKTVCRVLKDADYDARGATSMAEIDALLQDFHPSVALVDVRMDTPGVEVLQKLKTQLSGIEVIMMSGYGTIDDAVECMQHGAVDFLPKPFPSNEGMLDRVRKAAQAVEGTASDWQTPDMIWGRTPQMESVKRIIKVVGPSETTALITGETGTGKEVVARKIHQLSARQDRSFVPVNCSALSENIVEGELFGHEKGSFTGANHRKEGLFHEADGGTLFLDEVGELPKAVQAKFLRALQEGEIRRVGSTVAEKVDVRILAATNRDLEEAVQAGEFREDLLYRLNIVHLELPPLRERQEDILAFAEFFLSTFGDGAKLTPKAQEALMSYAWPGNVRELRNVIEHAALFAERGLIYPHTLPKKLLEHHYHNGARTPILLDKDYQGAKNEFLRHFDRFYFESLMERTNNNMSKAAELAGMDRSNFRKQLLKNELI